MVAAIVQQVAADVDELARARRMTDLAAAAAHSDRRAERRRRVAEPDLDLVTRACDEICTGS